MRAAVAITSLVVVLALPFTATAVGSPPAQPYAAQPPSPRTLFADGQTGRYLLDGEWLYRADRADAGSGQGWWRDVTSTDGWSPVSVPNAYNAQDFSNASMSGYVGWYRRDFTLPRSAFPRSVPARFRRWLIRFESVNYRATVWLNGRQIGTHAEPFLPFELDMTGLRAGVNRLIVRVDNRRSFLDVPSGGSGWWNYGGLLREVYLRAVSRADLAQVQLRPVLPCPRCAATIEDRVLVRNVTAASQTVRLRGTYGRAVLDFGSATIQPHGTWTARASALIARPRLWSPDRPALYRATLTLVDASGRRIGAYTAHSGIRTIKVTAGGRLELNGRLLNLRGVNLHEQNLESGAALDPTQISRLFGWVRSLGATLIRSHYPLNPQIQELADRTGILLWSEIPVWRVNTRYLADPVFLANARKMLADNILTNQNHPSVLLWSVGNELPPPSDDPAVANYIRSTAARAHALDPTRPVAMAGVDAGCHGAYGVLDVLGWNEYFGWFDAGAGATDDRDALSPALDGLRGCYPTKALMVTEFGFDANRHGPVEERGTYEFQSNSLAYHLHVFDTKPWLSGAISWLLQDFVAWPGWAGGNPLGTPPFVTKGVVDFQGNPKPAFSLVSSMYHATAQVGPDPGGHF